MEGKPASRVEFSVQILSCVQLLVTLQGFPGGSAGKESACNAGDQGSIPGLERSPGEGNGNPLQYSCLENFIDYGAFTVSSPKKPQAFNLVNQAKARCGGGFLASEP